MTDQQDQAAPTATGQGRSVNGRLRDQARMGCVEQCPEHRDEPCHTCPLRKWQDEAADPRTADDLWRWLLACTDCHQLHTLRQVADARDAWTWRHPDGHQYRTRAGSSLGALTQLRAEWQRAVTG